MKTEEEISREIQILEMELHTLRKCLMLDLNKKMIEKELKNTKNIELEQNKNLSEIQEDRREIKIARLEWVLED